MQQATPKWKELFEISFFTDDMKEVTFDYWKVG
jgi:hypothetical protein